MARTWALLSLCLLSNCFLLQLCDVVAESEGLSIKFIHRYSPDSPFYQANLTYGERLVNLSKLHANYLAADAARSATGSNSSDQTVAHPTAIRSLVGVQQGIYMVQLSIGTFHTLPPSPSYKSFFLVLDTGSYLTWTQCELCKTPGHECFVQEEPIFPNSQSQTYRPLPCGKDRLCYTGQCIGDACSYKRDYASGCSSQGVLATRTFTFVSDNRIDTKRIDGFVFGCGIDNKNFKYEAGNQIAGIMGLGWGDRSLINQPQSLSHGRFSYCLQPLNNPHESSSMFLRIGGDIVQRQGLGITPISSRSKKTRDGPYYLDLLGIGIGIGETRLPIPPKTFVRRKDRTGGCVIDSGSAISQIVKAAYDVLRNAMVTELSGFNIMIIGGQSGFDLCYALPDKERFKDLPPVTFHFRDADMKLKPEATYAIGVTGSGQQYFCLAMLPIDFRGLTIIGAFQQTNQRFIFDTSESKLYFGPEDCTRSGV